MLTTIDFDNTLRVEADEIHDIGTDGCLSRFQVKPESSLGVGHRATERSGTVGERCIPTPALPRRGGGRKYTATPVFPSQGSALPAGSIHRWTGGFSMSFVRDEEAEGGFGVAGAPSPLMGEGWVGVKGLALTSTHRCSLGFSTSRN